MLAHDIDPRVMNAKGTAFALAGVRALGDGNAYRFHPPEGAADGHYDIYYFRSELMVTVRRLTTESEWRSSDNGDMHLCFCFHLQGSRQILVDDDSLYRLAEPSFVAFYQPVEQPKHMIWQNGESELAVTIAFSPELLHRELGLHPNDLPLLLQQFLPGRERPSFLWMRGPLQRQMQLAARALTDPQPLEPSLLPTFIKAKASELLCLGLQAAHDLMGEGEAVARTAPRYQVAARQARQLIDGSEGARLSIQEMARRLRVDPTNLCAAFKAAVGETIFAYSNRVRMEKAQALLADDGCSLKQVSHALGFNQPAAFSVAFKRFTGLTPDAYRRLVQRRQVDRKAGDRKASPIKR